MKLINMGKISQHIPGPDTVTASHSDVAIALPSVSKGLFKCVCVFV